MTACSTCHREHPIMLTVVAADIYAMAAVFQESADESQFMWSEAWSAGEMYTERRLLGTPIRKEDI